MDAVKNQLDVTKLDHGVYKLDLICMQHPGALVKLSQAIEAFVIEVVHSTMVVINSTKVTCTFIVKVNVHVWFHIRRESSVLMYSSSSGDPLYDLSIFVWYRFLNGSERTHSHCSVHVGHICR